MKKLTIFTVFFILFSFTQSFSKIVIPTHNWSSQIVGAYVIGGIFESIGNKVIYKNYDSQAVYESIRKGKVSISHEVWESAFGRSFNNALSKGGIIDAGLHPAPTMEDIGVPSWVIEKNLCPGLPNWEALKNCAEVFARSGSNGKGIILEGPQTWHGDLIPQRIDALGLGNKYKVKFAKSADQLWRELYEAKKKGKGILMFNWSPNFTDAEGFTMIKWPKYYAGCRPADGGSGACGSPWGYLKKAASSKFANQHPDAFNVFKKISFTTKDMGKMAYYVDVEKMTHKDAAKKWLRKNKYKWKYWIGRTDIAYNAFDQQKIEQDSFYETTTKIVKKQKKEEKKKVSKKTKTQEEFKPKTENLDQNPPKIKIASAITVNDTDYEIEGYVKDESDKIYIQAEGRPIKVKDGKFIIRRFSPIDEEISIVAIDQWGNRSKPKVVKITIDLKDTSMAEKLEPLNPSVLNNKESSNTAALIIGIEKYKKSPDATYANLDAKYFNEYARKGFGIKKKNIKLLVNDDANLIDTITILEKWLPAKIKPNETNLIIFFAGHGLASNDGKELYLLTQDSEPNLLNRTALSRTELFETILKFNPKSVTMFFDTCYSGQTREEETLLASARPIRIVADEQDTPINFTIFTASQLDQISSGLKDAKHGIFSYYLMKGLEGKADANNDKDITNGELLAYMDLNISQKASELARSQNPSFVGDRDKVLMSYR